MNYELFIDLCGIYSILFPLFTSYLFLFISNTFSIYTQARTHNQRHTHTNKAINKWTSQLWECSQELILNSAMLFYMVLFCCGEMARKSDRERGLVLEAPPGSGNWKVYKASNFSPCVPWKWSSWVPYLLNIHNIKCSFMICHLSNDSSCCVSITDSVCNILASELNF